MSFFDDRWPTVFDDVYFGEDNSGFLVVPSAPPGPANTELRFGGSLLPDDLSVPPQPIFFGKSSPSGSVVSGFQSDLSEISAKGEPPVLRITKVIRLCLRTPIKGSLLHKELRLSPKNGKNTKNLSMGENPLKEADALKCAKQLLDWGYAVRTSIPAVTAGLAMQGIANSACTGRGLGGIRVFQKGLTVSSGLSEATNDDLEALRTRLFDAFKDRKRLENTASAKRRCSARPRREAAVLADNKLTGRYSPSGREKSIVVPATPSP